MASKATASAKKSSARSPRRTKVAKRPARKTDSKRSPVRKKSASKTRAPSTSSTRAKNKKTRSQKLSAHKKSPAVNRAAVLGRPKVPGTAELDQLFLKDYEARQVFAFLGVKTIKELEEHPPDEIIERLTGPMVRTVERIRKALAVNNRYLSGDQKFAVQFRRQIR